MFWLSDSFTSRYTLDFRLADASVRQRMRLFVLHAAAELASSCAYEAHFAVLWLRHVKVVRGAGSGTVPPHPALIELMTERNPGFSASVSALPRATVADDEEGAQPPTPAEEAATEPTAAAMPA